MSTSVRPKRASKSALKRQAAQSFTKIAREEFRSRLAAVLEYNWVMGDDEGRPFSVELVLVLRDYRSADEDRVYEVAEEVQRQSNYEVILSPRVYDHDEFVGEVTEPWEPFFIIREGRVIYDDGLIERLRGQPATAGR